MNISFRVRQRFPNFFSGFTPKETIISSREELLVIPFIKRWIDNDNWRRIFKVKRNGEQHLIEVEMKNDSRWVIAWIWGPIDELEMEEELYPYRR